jgi:hypothetical protein
MLRPELPQDTKGHLSDTAEVEDWVISESQRDSALTRWLSR